MERREFEIHLGVSSADSTVKVDGRDITSLISGVSVWCEAGRLTQVTLKPVPGRTPVDVTGVFVRMGRCDNCTFWQDGTPLERGDTRRPCAVLNDRYTAPDFGCVRFFPKSTPAQAAE